MLVSQMSSDVVLVLQELSIYGKLRKVSNCGPVSMFRSLLVTWKGKYPPHVISKRVKDFFRLDAATSETKRKFALLFRVPRRALIHN